MDSLLRLKILFPIAERLGGRNISSKVRMLQEDTQLSFAERSARMKRQLYTVLKTAQLEVPYYSDLFNSLGFDPEWIKKDLRYFHELPYLTKDIIREQGSRLLNKTLNPHHLHTRKTGGSTGPTLPVYYNNDSLDWTAAQNIHALSITGHKMCGREVHLASQPAPFSSLRERLSEIFKNFACNRVVLSCASLDDDSLEKIRIQLKNIRPYLVQGAPSVLYALALHIQKNNIPKDRLFYAFESTGETLDDIKRSTIESQIGCKVYNRYGTAEFGVIAHSHELHNKLEVTDYLVYPESYSLGNGLNELALTGLTNMAMPLIRYKTGDICEVTFEKGKYWLSKLQGRVHDLIYINGKPHVTTYLQDMLERVGGVDEFQIYINSQGQKTLKIVPAPSCDKELIVRKSQDILGHDYNVEFTTFNGLILQGWRSKFRYVVKPSV